MSDDHPITDEQKAAIDALTKLQPAVGVRVKHNLGEWWVHAHRTSKGFTWHIVEHALELDDAIVQTGQRIEARGWE